ncbi:MAG: hypothetical protein E4H23_09635 [Chrysiogenales bacterium]|nr:MAG: hypothetical protein E4H23_09635 [Chrysiogenales bacterium]
MNRKSILSAQKQEIGWHLFALGSGIFFKRPLRRLRILLGAAGTFFAFTDLHSCLSSKGTAALKSRLAAGVFELIDKIFGAHVSPAVIIPRFSGIWD